MADKTQRFTVQIGGGPELEKLAKQAAEARRELEALQRALQSARNTKSSALPGMADARSELAGVLRDIRSIKQAQAQVLSGGMGTAGGGRSQSPEAAAAQAEQARRLLARATGGATNPMTMAEDMEAHLQAQTVRVNDARGKMAAVEKQHADTMRQQTQKVAEAKTKVNTIDKQASQALRQQQSDYSQLIGTMSRSTDATQREWAMLAKLNLEREKAARLAQQLGLVLPQGTTPSLLGGLLPGAQIGANRVTGIAGAMARQTAYGIGAATGIPGAGAAAAGGTSLIAQVAGAIGPIGDILAAVTALVLVGKAASSTADAMIRAMQQQITGGAALLGTGNRQSGANTTVGQILGVGNAFMVPMSQNQQAAAALTQLGIGSVASAQGENINALPETLGAGYAIGTQTGRDFAQTTEMLATMMLKQKIGVDQATQSWLRYAQAGRAAGVSAGRMFDIATQLQGINAQLAASPGQLASLQAQLGPGISPVSLMGPALSASGFQAMAEQGILGLTQGQFENAQRNPAQLFDIQAQRLRTLSGGNTQVLAGLMSTVGLDTSNLSVTQIQNLSQMIASGQTGAAMSYYNQYVAAGMQGTNQSTAAFIAQQSAVRRGTITPLEAAKAQAPYALIGALEPQLGQDFAAALGLPPGSIAVNGSTAIQRGMPGYTPPAVPNPGPGPGQSSAAASQMAAIKASLPAAAQPYFAAYMAAEHATGIPWQVLVAQDMGESQFTPDVISGKVISSAGAIGIGQVTPGAAKQVNMAGADLTNPATNIMVQAQYDKYLLGKVGGDYGAMFAAYNEGLGNYQNKGVGGADQTYLDVIGKALQELVDSGVAISVDVTVRDAMGNVMPSRSAYTKGPTTSHVRSPGPGSK